MFNVRRGGGLCLRLAIIGLAASTACAAEPATMERLMPALEAEHSRVRALKAHYPEDYERLKNRISGALNRRDETGIGQAMETTFGEVVRRQIDRADGETTYAIGRLLRYEAAILRSSDPQGCLDVLDGRSSPETQRKVLTSEAKVQDDAAMAQFLAQTALRPARPVQPIALEELLPHAFKALQTLPEGDQDLAIAILREKREPADAGEAKAYCAFRLALMDVFLAMPSAVGGEAMRRMAAMD